MKKTVLVYGLIAGTICGGMIAISGVMNSGGSLNFEYGMFFGFGSMLLAAIIMWFGMARYKKDQGGKVSFGKLFLSGVWMAFIASSMYVFTWMAMYNTAFKNFGEKYAEFKIASMKKEGKLSPDELAKEEKKTRADMAHYDNSPAYRLYATYMEIFPLEVVMVLIAATVMTVRGRNRTATA